MTNFMLSFFLYPFDKWVTLTIVALGLALDCALDWLVKFMTSLPTEKREHGENIRLISQF